MNEFEETIKRMAQEIDSEYNHPAFDYRGRTIDKAFVAQYLYSSYHRTIELARYVGAIGVDKRVLDIGIGYGFYDVILKDDFGLDVVGMELPENIPTYCHLPKLHGIDIIAGDLSKAPCPIDDNSFDIVLLIEVIEHLRMSPYQALREIWRILRPGGVLVLTTPNVARFVNILKLLVGRNIVQEFHDDHRPPSHVTDSLVHIREYTMGELTSLLGRAGYEIVEKRYSLANDRLPHRQLLRKRRKSVRLIGRLAQTILPTLRSLLFITTRKVAYRW